MEIRFKRDTSFRKQFFVSDSLMRIILQSGVFFMLFNKTIMLTTITFFARRYEIVKTGISVFRVWYFMVNLEDNIRCFSPAVLAGKIVSAQYSKAYPKSTLFKVVVFALTFNRAELLPIPMAYKALTTLKASIETIGNRMSETIISISLFVSAFVRAIHASAISHKLSSADSTMPLLTLMIASSTTHKYIVAQYTGDCK